MNLTDDYLLEHVSQDRANLQMGMYCIYLASGETLYHKMIKVSSIEKYLCNVAMLISPSQGSDPRYRLPTDRALAPDIKKILDPLKKWEELPNQRLYPRNASSATSPNKVRTPR